MKILFYPTSLNFRYVCHASKIIGKKNAKIKFGFIHKIKENHSKLDEENIKNLKKSKLNYRLFFIKNKLNQKKIDEKYLKYFERISKINIWKIISSDRVLGRAYINDIHAYRSNYTKENVNEILINFIDTAKKIEKIFLTFRPNVIYISNGQSNIETSIMNIFAIKYKVKIIVPEPTRLGNFFFFSPSIYIVNNEIKNFYLKNKKIKKNFSEINNIYNQILKKGALKSEYETSKNDNFLKPENIFQKIFGNTIYVVCKHIFFYLLFLFGYKNYHLNVLTKYNFYNSIVDEISLRKILTQMLNLKTPDLKKKYIYFPLHLIPETSTLLMGNDYMNQGFLVELISKSIPSNCLLYVKEHPAMFTSHGRKKEFYERLKALPNVKLVPINIDGIKLIQNSELVIVVDGTSGFEAMLIGKPVVTMKYYSYSFLNLTKTNYNINNLNKDIKDAISSNKKVSPKILRNKIKKLIYAIINTSHLLRKPDIFYYNKKNSSIQDQQICGEDLALAMIKELNIKNVKY